MASPEGVFVLTIVTGEVLIVDRASWADRMDNDPIRRDREDGAPVADAQAQPLSLAFERLHVVGEASGIACVGAELPADQILGVLRQAAEAPRGGPREDQRFGRLAIHRPAIPPRKPTLSARSLA